MKRIVLAHQKVRSALFLVLLLPFASRVLAATPSALVAEFDASSPSRSLVEPAPTDSAVSEPVGVLTLGDAIAAALRRNPSLASYPWEIRALDARAIQAGLRPNPSAGFSTENFAGTGTRSGYDDAETSLWLSQLVEVGGKRTKRRRVAELGRSGAECDYESARLGVLIETSRAFIAVLATQERYSILEELVGVARDAVRTAEAQFRAGAAPAVERTRAEVTKVNAQVELDFTARELAVRRVALASTWGTSVPAFSGVTGDFEAVFPPPSLSDLESLIDANPILKRAEVELEYRGALVDLAEANRLPDPTVQIGARHFSGGDDQALIMQLAVPLPIFDRNQGTISAARHDLSKAKVERSARERALNAALALAHERSIAAFERVEATRDHTLPAARRAFEEARAAYGKGRFRYLDVLDAQRTLFELRARYVDTLADYHLARIAIEAATAHPLREGGHVAKENLR